MTDQTADTTPSTLKKILTAIDIAAGALVASGQLSGVIVQVLGALCLVLTYLGYGNTKTQLAQVAKATAISLLIVLPLMASCAAAQKIASNGLTCAGKELTWANVAEVAMDLEQPNFAALLTQLAVTDTKAVVDCITQTVVAAQPPAATGSDATAMAVVNPIVEHGNAWLSGTAQ